MNKIFLIISFLINGQFMFSFQQPSSDHLQYINFLPEGKVKEHCKKSFLRTDSDVGLINGGLVRILNRLIWAAIKEKKWSSMTESERLAFKDISIVWFSDNHGNIAINMVDWKKNDFEVVRKIVVNIVVREMVLSPDQEHQEVTKIINMFSEFKADIEKISKLPGQNKLLYHSSRNADFPSNVVPEEE
ncbi:MAG: hypothetical protein WCD44_02820 [Candidatus Babeliales bacterium]